MISERLYYHDSYIKQFDAEIIEVVQANGRSALILDKTYFYPTSGGQPNDLGTIDQLPITNVEIRTEDGRVLHWLKSETPEKKQVTGLINWERRFDHMQQHTGQHILSQAFIQVANAETIGFHLSENSVTIDLNTISLQEKQLEQVETLANQTVWQNLPIQIRMISSAEAASLPLRKIPEPSRGKLRIVEIGDFDRSACGGTHVSATGAVGIIKLLKTEKRRGNMRIEFCCGNRALHDFQQKHTIITQLSAELTTGSADLTHVVTQMLTEAKQQRRQIKQQQSVIITYQAEEIIKTHPLENNVRIIIHTLEEAEANDMMTLAKQLTQNPTTVVLLGCTNHEKTQLLFSRSEDAPGDMNVLIKQAFQILGNGSGGGRANQAQGGGTSVSAVELQQILNKSKEILITHFLAS